MNNYDLSFLDNWFSFNNLPDCKTIEVKDYRQELQSNGTTWTVILGIDDKFYHTYNDKVAYMFKKLGHDIKRIKINTSAGCRLTNVAYYI